MNIREIKLDEISDLTGVSENQILKNFKQYLPKLELLGISKEGKGKNAKYYITDNSDNDNFKIAYDTFIGIFRDAFYFDSRTDFDSLLLFMGYIQSHTLDKDHYFTIRQFSFISGIHENTLYKYVKHLKEYKILNPKDLSKKYYIALSKVEDIEGNLYRFAYDITELMQYYELDEIWTGQNIPDKYRNPLILDMMHRQILGDLDKYSIFHIRKLEYTTSFLNDEILQDILYNAYCYKLINDKTFLNITLELENINTYIKQVPFLEEG